MKKIVFKNDPRKRPKLQLPDNKPRIVQGILHLQELNRAREYYNPLRGLNVSRLITLLEQANRGQNSYWQALCEIIEVRDATLLSLIERRSSAIGKLDWKVKPMSTLPRGFSDRDAERQAEFLGSIYEQVDNLKEAILFLELASFRGYSHLEIHRDEYGDAVKFEPVHQWHWLRSFNDYSWVYDATAKNNTSNAVSIEEGEFIVREVARPLNQLAAICYVRKDMGKKDWDAFIETFGIPSIFGILSPNTPETKVEEWLNAMEKVVGNSRGALPPGSDIKTLAEGSKGNAPFLEHIKYQNEELVLAGTGGKLTMLAESGSGTLAGNAHQDAFDDIAIAEAGKISEIFQKQFDRVELAREFPSQPVLCYFQIAAEDDEDLDSLADRLVKLDQAGFEADEAEVSEKFGMKLKRKAAPVQLTPEKGKKDQPDDQEEDPAAAAMKNRGFPDEELSGIFASDFSELVERLVTIERMDDETAALAALQNLLAEFPDMAAKILKSKGVSGELEKLYSKALVEGAVNGRREHAQTSPTKA